MSGRDGSRLERVVEGVLTAGPGLGAALLLLLAASLRGDARLLQGGILLLMVTPVCRVVLVTVGLFQAARPGFSAASPPSVLGACWP